MDFWAAQQKARKRTKLILFAFVLLTLVAASIAEYLLRVWAPNAYHPTIPTVGLVFLGATFLVAIIQYLAFKTQGGAYVAESMGGQKVDPNTANPNLRQLMNIVNEIALASHQQMPSVYIIPSHQINAFAAGITPQDAAVAISLGALEKLNRDEIQGVIAHEFGHIYNRDMKMSLQLAAMVMGFYFLLYYGFRMLQISGMYGMPRDYNYERGGNISSMIGYLFLIAGVFSWFFGSLLKSMVSRQREYLADACAVQFTRNPNGIANALKKIRDDKDRDLPFTSMAYSHMLIDNHSFWSELFATHPPIDKRIEAILGGTYKPDKDLV